MDIKRYTADEWRLEGRRRFGDDVMNWKFLCPMCGHVASVRDFKNAGASGPDCAYTECIGRYIGKGSPKKVILQDVIGAVMDYMEFLRV